MAELQVTVTTDGSIALNSTDTEYQISAEDTTYKVGLAEYGGYGPRGLQGIPGTVNSNPSQIPVVIDGTTTDLQSALTQLSTLFFQQAVAPTAGVNSGDLWYDTTANVLKVYQDANWVTVIAQTNVNTINIDSGYF